MGEMEALQVLVFYRSKYSVTQFSLATFHCESFIIQVEEFYFRRRIGTV